MKPSQSCTNRFLTPDKLEKEYELAVKDNRAGGGPKMLLGENHVVNLPSTLGKFRTLMNKAPEATNPKGRIGEVYPNFAAAKKDHYRYKEFKWYGQMIYAPSLSEDILKAEYGTDCLTHRHGNKGEEAK